MPSLTLLVLLSGVSLGVCDAPDFVDAEPFDTIDLDFGQDPELTVPAHNNSQAPAPPPAPPTFHSSCSSPNQHPTFLKVNRVVPRAIPKFVHSMENLPECLAICRSGLEPVEQTPFECSGLMFAKRSHGSVCEIFDQNAMTMSLMPENHPENRSLFFERACLRIPTHCADAAYSFEMLPGKWLNVNILTEMNVADQSECLDKCLTIPACKSVNFHRSSKLCQIIEYEEASHRSRLEDNRDVNYIENTCAQQSEHCASGQRIDFVVTKNARLDGLEIKLGPMSIKNCMRECADSKQLKCRSFQYEALSKECVIGEEQAGSTKSDNSDLYEPICLDSQLDLPCTGDFVFEKVHHTNLLVEDVIAVIKETTVDQCMHKCLHEPRCLSFTFNVAEQKCKILPLNRHDTQTRSIVETFIDYYELSCDRKGILGRIESQPSTAADMPTTTPAQSEEGATTASNACDMSKSVLIEQGRTLRMEYRNLHHVNIKSIDECQSLCQETTIPCQTFAYNSRTGDCLLSTLKIDKDKRFLFVTQPNPSYELYAFLGRACSLSSTTTVPPTLVSLPKNTTSLNLFPSVHEYTVNFELSEDSTVGVKSTTDPNERDPFEKEDVSRIDYNKQHHKHHHDATNAWSRMVVSTQPHVTSTESTAASKVAMTESSNSNSIQLNVDDFAGFPSPPEQKAPATVTLMSTMTPVSAMGQTGPRRDKNLTRFRPEQISVVAMCLEKGVNVSFAMTDSKYSGAVYAAERFGQCREFVETSHAFSIFVARPSSNNNCNALEEDGVLTAVLVLSNDMVLPYDVTTKDDFFYQVTCNYGAKDVHELVHAGIVVGGPEPKSVMMMSKKTMDDTETKVVLRILKNNRPVTNVYIGEKLTAVVESDVDSKRLRVTDCNATRVGGREPRPSSVVLIQNGCARMPQVMGNIQRGPHGLEAPFTAFRIDGSDQIDIICSVVVCRTNCQEQDAPCQNNRPKRALLRTVDDDQITVDQRLRVLVVEGDAADGFNVLNMFEDGGRNKYCINSTLMLAVLFMFVFSLVIMISCTVWVCCNNRKDLMDDLGGHIMDQTMNRKHFHIPRVERYVA